MSFSIPCESWGSATQRCDQGMPSPLCLSVFPANRGVLRQPVDSADVIRKMPFSIPCESWGSATHLDDLGHGRHLMAFSIPCESWGSATYFCRPAIFIESQAFSIPCESWGSATPAGRRRGPRSLRLSVFPANRGVLRRQRLLSTALYLPPFQYSLRIVGFCDTSCDKGLQTVFGLSVFPANRGVLRRSRERG